MSDRRVVHSIAARIPSAASARAGRLARWARRWTATSLRATGRLAWMASLRSPRSMGFRTSTILWARMGALFFAALIAFSVHARRHGPATASQIILARDYRLRRQVAAAIHFEWLWRDMDIDGWVNDAARRHDVDADLIHAVIQAESNYRPDAISRVGACGLMQIMPNTVRHLNGGNPFDPRENIDMGARYLAELSRRFNNDRRLTVAAYNAGPGAVRRHGGVPPYNETRVYVDRVMSHYGARKARQVGADRTEIAARNSEEMHAATHPMR